MTFDTLVVEPFGELFLTVTQFIPPIMTALLILILGYLICTVIRRFLYESLQVIKFDKLAYNLGLVKVLQTGGIKVGPCMLVSHFVYAIMMVMVLIMTVKALGIPIGHDMITRLMMFIPGVVTGVLILIIGMLVAHVVPSLIYVVATNTEMPSPEVLARITKISILVYVTITFLSEIGFVGLFTGIHYTIFISGIVFTLALSFGLAGRTVAGKYLEALRK